MPTYSFQDVHAAIRGPGGIFSMSDGEGVAKEGITIEPVEDKNIMTVGACGGIMHSLIASKAVTVTIRLLKINPVNALLQHMFNQQTASAQTHGKNIITVRDTVRGDSITISNAAFRNQPAINYASEGGSNEWKFDGCADHLLGFGTPEIG